MTDPSAPERTSGPPPSGFGCGRAFALFGGIALIALGIPMLVCPGPGLLSIATGAAMVLGALGIRRPQNAPPE